MIDAFWLIWIIPLSALAGALGMAFLAGAAQYGMEMDIYNEGVAEGFKRAHKMYSSNNSHTLFEFLSNSFDLNLDIIKETTGGIIYGEDLTCQMFMIMVDSLEDLEPYYQNVVLSSVEEGTYIRPVIKAEMV